METRALIQWMFTAGLTLFTSIHRLECDKIADIDVARQWLREYNIRAMDVYSKAVAARWDYNTNLTDYNQRRAVSTINFSTRN